VAHLGEFGRELAELDTTTPADDDTFTFHGVTFTIPNDIGDMPLLRYSWRAMQARDAYEAADAAAAAARTDAERDEAETMYRGLIVQQRASVFEYLRSVIGEPQWPEFERVAERHAATQDELLGVSRQVIAAVAARPTRRPSGSAGGPSASGGGSADASPSTPSPPPGPGPEADSAGSDAPPLTDRERAIAAMGMVPLDVAARAAKAASATT
jgi:hypothetical protein